MDPKQLKAIKKFVPNSTIELLLNPVAKEVGYTIAGVYYSIFGKLIKYGVVKKAETDALIKQVAQKYDNIPEKDRTNINKGLIYKAFEDSRYSLSSEELRDLFSNLIANSANVNNTKNASPYYSTILKNLSRNNAKFLARFKSVQSLAIVKIRFIDSKAPKNFTDYKQDYILNKNNNAKKENIKAYSEEIDTLESLGLVKRKYGQTNDAEEDDIKRIYRHINDMHLDKKLPGHFKIKINSDKKQEIFINKYPYDAVQIIPGSLDLTELGKSFVRMVLF